MNSNGIAFKNRPSPDAVRVVICGEVSSGKSTVLNAILRTKLLPDNLGSATRPIVYVRHGTQAAQIRYPDGTTYDDTHVASPEKLRNASEINLQLDLPHLAGLELVEVPLTTAEDLSSEHIDLIRSADALIWVTISSQAWRLTEKNILDRLADALPERSLMVLSRADKLRSKADRDKVLDRMKRETSDLFKEYIFMSASQQKLDTASASQEGWNETGGAQVVAQLTQITSAKTPDVSASEVAKQDAESEVTRQAVIDLVSYRLAADSKSQAKELPETVECLGADTQEFYEADSLELVRTETSVNPEHLKTFMEPEPIAADEDFARCAAALRPLVSSAQSAIMVGLSSFASAGGCEVLNGDHDEATKLAQTSRHMFDMLSDAYAAHGGGFEAITLSSADGHLLLEAVANVGVIFVCAPRNAMNQGSARNLLTRLVKAAQSVA